MRCVIHELYGWGKIERDLREEREREGEVFKRFYEDKKNPVEILRPPVSYLFFIFFLVFSIHKIVLKRIFTYCVTQLTGSFACFCRTRENAGKLNEKKKK
jgi:hypothetical protein